MNMLLQFKCLLQEGDGIVKSFKKVKAEVFGLHKMMRIKNSMRITPAPPAPLRGQSSAELNRGLSSISLAKYTYLLATHGEVFEACKLLRYHWEDDRDEVEEVSEEAGGGWDNKRREES
jgi:hypothetical protein